MLTIRRDPYHQKDLKVFEAKPDAVFAIANKIYVDEYLSSVKNLDLAIKAANDVNITLVRGDIHLKGWISNSIEFFTAISLDCKAATRSLGPSKRRCRKRARSVLASINIPSDHICEVENVTLKKVNMLSKVANIFDPLGMVLSFTVKAKIRLQELALENLKWEEEVVDQDR